jgi:predicted nucleic acid-binding protein
MISIDTNILLYSLNPDSIWHGAAVGFLQQNLGIASVRIAIADYVLVELYVLLRNPAVMSKALTAKAARDLVMAYWYAPNVSRIENANVMDEVWKLAGAGDFARRRIFDARLALTLRQGGVTHFATSNVKDFEDWGFEKVWNPLILSKGRE